jgi:hypothetical protein
MSNIKNLGARKAKAPSSAPVGKPKSATGNGRKVAGQQPPTTGPGSAASARDAAGKVGGKC